MPVRNCAGCWAACANATAVRATTQTAVRRARLIALSYPPSPRLRRGKVLTSGTVTQPALTSLSEDERLFRDSVYEFANREIRPLSREMDERAKIPPALVEKLFELGVMS